VLDPSLLKGVFMNAQLTQKLFADCRVLAADAEALLRAGATESVEKVTAARERMQQRLADIKPRLADAEAAIRANVRAATGNADAYVRDNPWTAAGIASGIGLLVGLLISRR
jgi:ElaB/YqjD/DUF883 family membrane-anchored ribosome-binding protein